VPQTVPLFCHCPVPPHVCGCCPLQFTSPELHKPLQAPPGLVEHVWLVPQTAPLFCHCPLPPHVCGCCMLQLSWFGAQTPVQTPVTVTQV
jgi:hypothetical protein